MVKPKGSIEEVEAEYQNRPRFFIVSFLVLMLLFIIIQSYIAQPRNLGLLFSDVWELSVLFLMIIYVFWRKKNQNLLIFGIIFLAVFILMLLGALNFIEKSFGTLFLLGAIWFIGDWINIKVFKKGIFTELLRGNYYLMLGILLSTLLVGVVVELSNIPFKLWWYNWSIPSLEILGLRVVYIIFGWLPWILAMFVIFYPFATKRPKKFNKK
tara:strand:- start:89 stop:721 length:633 start_codon:yes stop_codon:yes gene_type:complete